MTVRPRSAARGRRVGIAGAAVVLSLAVAPFAAAGAGHHVTVLDSGGGVAATFQSAKCTKNKRGFFATTPHPNSQKLLHVRIEDFTGFHDYDLTVGGNADPYVVYQATNDERFSNLNRPPFPSPGSGQVRFARHGTLMGVGFSPAYNPNGSDAVTFTGVLKCKYPKR